MKKLVLSLILISATNLLAATDAPVWRVSGFLKNGKTKTWVTVSGSTIVCVDQTGGPVPKKCIADFDPDKARGVPTLDTDKILLPGMMDLHNHIEFNSLPLWKDANGSYKNRFEWRGHKSYQNGMHKYFMRKMKEDPEFSCLSLKWSEIKALVSGTTSIQGLGRKENHACARDFGIRNLEISESMGIGKNQIGGSFEVINPDLMNSGFEAFIRPHLTGDYDQALDQAMAQYSVKEWLTIFSKEPHTFENGLRLLIGPKVETYLSQNSTPLTLATLPAFVQGVLTQEREALGLIKPEQVVDYGTRIMNWLTGKSIEGVGYMDLQPSTPNIDAWALKFLAPSRSREADGILNIPRKFREYLVEFEFGTMASLRRRLAPGGPLLAYFTHLAEGRALDEYNQKEFAYAESLKLLSPNMVFIHGVGLNESQIALAKEKGTSFVWSPSSNLLLYGETFNIQRALQIKANLGLGSDWSITGTKNILDEMKVAARFSASKKIPLSSKTLVNMVTDGPAKILKVDRPGGLGKIEPGYLADFVLLNRRSSDVAKSVVVSESEDVQLVVVNGEPLYGEVDLLEKSSQAVGDMIAPDSLGATCEKLKNKGIRLLSYGSKRERIEFSKIKSSLEEKFKLTSEKYKTEGGAEDVTVDPLFPCEDEFYQGAISNLIKQ